jgi:hypothetical protein
VLALFVEVVFETGRSSIMQVESEEEALAGMAEQHRRAKMGEPAGPQGGPAERVVKAFVYDRHPDDWNAADTLTADELKKTLPKLIEALADDNGVVPVGQLSSEVRGLTHPMLNMSGPHDSNFRMPEKKTIEGSVIDKKADELKDGAS